MHKSVHGQARGLLLALLVGTASVVVAEEWIPLNGPSGADIRNFAASAANPSRVYATDFHGGMFVSNDRGASWQPCRDGLGVADGNPSLLTVTIDPVDEAILYTGNSDGLYKSVDSGVSWQRILTGVIPWETAVSPRDHDRLIIGTTTGLYSSTDGGANWDFDRAGYIFCVKFNPLHPDTVIAYDNTAGVLRSTNEGMSWNLISTQLPAGRNLLRIDPATPSRLYALANNASDTNAVYKSTNGGVTWVAKHSIDRWMSDIALDQQDPANIWVAADPPDFQLGAVLWKSTDFGESWVELRLPTSAYHYVPYARAVEVDPANGSNILVGIPWVGILRSTDHGASWSAPHVPGAQLQDFVQYDTTAGYVYTSATAGNLWRVTPGGHDWTRLTDSTHSRVEDLAINPRNSQEMYVASSWNGAVHKSTDGGASWRMTSLYDLDVNAIAISSASPNVLVAGATNPTSVYGVYVSNNSGVTWGRTLSGQFYHVAIHPVSADTMLAANQGAMGEQTNLYRSTDQGNTWEVVFTDGSGGSGCANLIYDPVSPNAIYASTFYHGVVRSTDGGNNWDSDLGGFHGRGTIRDIKVDPANGDVYLSLTDGLYAGEVYRSTNRGDSWTLMSNAGRWPVNTAVWCIDVKRSNDSLALIVGTRGCGLYSWGRLPGVGIRGYSVIPGCDPGLTAIPNPFSARTEIRLPECVTTARSVLIHDCAGRLVRTLSIPGPGFPVTRVVWNGRNDNGQRVKPGIYFASLSGSGSDRPAKMIVAR